jgi:4-amino-4-deoxy-L-arabinose transferase-like glycosyltransferase
VLFLYGVAAGPLYRTESLRAIIARECLRGNWLFPVLYERPFLTKPPGHYVAIGLCSLPFGEVTAVTSRLPSVAAATASVFLLYGLFRRSLDERSALLAGVLMPTSVLWLDKVPSAEIDMTLVGWVTAAVVLVQAAVERGSTVWWVCALLAVVAGTLTKWTAPAFFYLTLGSWLLWRGQVRLLFGWRHLLAVAVALLVCSLWASAVSSRVGWGALLETLRSEAAYRFSPKSAATGLPAGEVIAYPLLVWAAHLPVSAFAVLTLRPGFLANWDERGRRLLQLLHCWTWPNLLFWSLVPNHNVRYALPLSPGLVGLGVMGLLGTVRSERALWVGVVGFLAVWLAVKVAFVEIVIPQRGMKRNPEPIAAELRDHVPAGVPLYLFRLKDEGVLFYYGRPAVRLQSPGELPAGAFAVLTRAEWDDRASFGHLRLVHWMHDQQGAPLILVRAP